MPKIVRIPVPEGIVGHGQTYHEIVLQEPSYGDYLDLGDLTTQCRTPDGSIMWVDNNEVIRDYIGKCLVSPKDSLVLDTQASLKVAMAVKAAVIGFFLPDRSVAEPSPTSPTTLSSESSPAASPQTPSAG